MTDFYSQRNQLIFEFFRDSSSQFDNFITIPKNREIIDALKNFAGADSQKLVYIFGKSGVGKTHLLHATVNILDKRTIYLPLDKLENFGLKFFDGLEDVDIIAIDGCDFVAGNRQYERPFFSLLNRVLSSSSRLLVTGKKHPKHIEFLLPDITSRLCFGLVYQIHSPPDERKQEILQSIANRKGLVVDEKVLNYILDRTDRDMKSLVTLFERLDEFCLKLKRLPTVPLVKKFLAESNFSP